MADVIEVANDANAGQTTVAGPIQSDRTCHTHSNPPCMRFFLGPLLVAGVLFGCFFGWSAWRFGSVANMRAYLTGYPIAADQWRLDVGEVAAGQEANAVFRLRNLTGRAITILGAMPDCSCCVVTSPLPITIAADESVNLAARFHARAIDVDSHVSHRILVHVDVDSPAIVLELNARVFRGRKD